MNRFRAVFVIALLSLLTVAIASTNYAVDFNASQKGHVSVAGVGLGETGTISVLFKLYKRDNNPFYIHGSADFENEHSKTQLMIVVKSNEVVVQLGSKKARFDFTSSQDRWRHYAVNIRNTGSGSHVELFVDNVSKGSADLTQTLVNAKREFIFNGYKRGTTVAGFTDSRFDDFVILNTITSSQSRRLFQANPSSPSDADLSHISLWVNFDDALAFQTNSRVSTAITSFSQSQSEWVEALLHKGASYVSFTNENFKQCYATGDPHLKVMSGYGESGNRLEYTYGHNLWASCDYVELRYYTRYTQWWGATVFRAFGVRVRDTVFRLNLDEFDPNERAGKGHLAPRLRIPFGFYKKDLYSKSWNSIAPSSSYRYDQESGTIYRYHGSTVTIQVPNVAEITVNGFSSSSRYMNLYSQLNDANCKFGAGSCFGDHFVYKDVLFRDYLPLPNLPDVPEPEVEPCDGVDAATLTDINKICKTVAGGSTSSADFLNCQFDACLSGDINIINLIEPTPSCLQAAATGQEADPECFNGQCKFFCSFRGECLGDGTCDCIAGYSQLDNCYTPDSYGCYQADYGDGRKVSVAPKYYLQSRGVASIEEGFTDDVSKYGLPNSVNIVPYYNNLNEHYLAVVVNSASSPESGHVDVCVEKSSLTLAKSARLYYSKKSFIDVQEDSGCYKVDFRAYEQVLLLFKAGVGIDAGLTQVFSLKNTHNVNQFLYSSYLQDRDEVLVTKVPNTLWSGFKVTMKLCDGDTCRGYGDCNSCVSDSKCGFCLEKGVCLEGDRTGPYFGSCQNWRFALNDPRSRVVTVTYTQDDLTNPDTDVFITSSDSASLPVNVIVPTTRASQFDVAFFLSTLGTYAVNAQQLKENLLEALYYVNDKNINLAIGHYNGDEAKLHLSMTRVQETMHFKYGEALATPRIGFEGVGGQEHALKKAASSSVGYRKHARRVVFLTVYDLNDLDDLRASRKNVFDNSLLPVFLVSGPRKESYNIIETLRRDVFDHANGFPGLVFYLEENGKNFRSVIESALELSASLPAVILDESSNLDHVDLDLLNQEFDATYIVGAVTSDLRARFVIPMKRPEGDDDLITAKIAIPGYGVSEITDVDRGIPTSKNDKVVGKEGSECIVVNLRGQTFKDLIQPLFQVTNNNNAILGEFIYQDLNGDVQTIDSGSTVTLTPAESKICFKPREHRHSTFNPTTGEYNPYADLQFKVYDGCLASEEYNVDIVVTPVYYAPEYTATPVNINEGTTGDQVITVSLSDDDFVAPDFVNREKLYITFGDFNVDYEPLFHDISGVNFFPGVTPGSKFEVPLPADWSTSNLATYDVTFNLPVTLDNFFGVVTLPFVLEDENGKATNGELVVNVNDVPDQPEIYPIAPDQVVGDDYYVWILEGQGADFTISARDIDSYEWTLSASVTYPGENVQAKVLTDGTPIQLTSSLAVVCSASKSTSLECKVVGNPTEDENYYTCEQTVANPAVPTDCSTLLNPIFTVNVVADDGTSTPVTKNFVVHIVNQYDAPNKPVAEAECFPEDEHRDFVIHGSDEDTLSEDLDVEIISVSPGVILTHVDGTDIGPLPAKLRNPLKREYTEDFVVRVKSHPHQHGEPSSFTVGSFKMRAVDSKGLKSEVETVNVCVYPVNDAPEQIVKTHIWSEDDDTVLDLTVKDIDTPADKITYVLTAFPETVRVFACDADPFFDEPLEVDAVIPACTSGKTQVVLVPDADWYGDATLSVQVTDTDMFETPLEPVVNVVDFTVDLVIRPVNDAPETYFPAITAQEDQPVVIDLQAINNRFGEEADEIIVEITRNLYGDAGVSGIGALYQFSAACEAGLATRDTSSCVEITEVPTTVTSGAVIYMPPIHSNSEPVTTFENEYYLVKPNFEFRARETKSHAEPTLLTSPDTPVSIFVSRVNDVPVSYGYDISAFSSLPYYSVQAPDFPATTECVSECEYLEDFGAEYPLLAGDEEIFFWGFDIEGGELSVFIESIECAGELKSFQYKTETDDWVEVVDDLKSLEKTYLPRSIPANSLSPVPLLTFSPALDAFNPEGKHFCTIQYTVYDGVDHSEISTINIDIESLDDAPRPVNDFDNTFNGLEDSLSLIYANAYDLEGNWIKVRVVDCNAPGQFYWPKEALASRISVTDGVVSVDISGLENPVEELFETESLNCKDQPTFSVSNEVFTNGWFIGYLPPKDNIETVTLEITYLDVNDVQSTPIHNTLVINPVNDAPLVVDKRGKVFVAGDKPVLAFNGVHLENPQVDGEFALDVIFQAVQPFPLEVSDSEALDFKSEMEYKLIANSNDAGCVFKVLSKEVGESFVIEDEARRVVQQSKAMFIECEKTGTSTFTILVSDKGAAGACPSMIAPNDEGVCERVTKVDIEVRASSPPLSIAAAALSGAGAGAFVLLALAGAAAAAFMKKNENDAQPWNEWDGEMGDYAHQNPLHESATVGGTNPLAV